MNQTMAKHRRDDSSSLAGEVKHTNFITEGLSPGALVSSSIQETAQRTRHTEVAALLPHNKRPIRLAWTCLYYAKIAMSPSQYPLVEDRPKKAQGGKRLLAWVGKRTDLTADEVEKYLNTIDEWIEIQEQRTKPP